MKLRQHAVVTDPGRRRRRNEDAYVVQPPLFAVADGMGGAQAGEIASRIAAAVLRDSAGEAGEDAVVALIQEANRRVYEAAASDEARAGMGTTVTAALVEDDSVRIGHVGDSRAYRVRDGALEQLTDDHSLVAELVRSGKLSPEEADIHPQRSVITRVLGTDPEVDVDTFEVEAQPGDVFMLCSDGLTSMVDDDGDPRRRRAQPRRPRRARRARSSTPRTRAAARTTSPSSSSRSARAPPRTRQTLPASRSRSRSDDEQTLTELDAVPAVDDTMLVSRRRARGADGRHRRPPRAGAACRPRRSPRSA